MHVGVCRLSLRLADSHSLKAKRGVVRSLVASLRSKFNVAVAEVDHNDHWQLVTLGIACVSNDRRQSNEVLSKVVAYVEETRLDLELVDYQLEIIPGV